MYSEVHPLTHSLCFAGSVASLWQQAGRAGRREQPSLSIYIGFDGPLDQFFMHQPAHLFRRPIETAQVAVLPSAAAPSPTSHVLPPRHVTAAAVCACSMSVSMRSRANNCSL